MLQVSNCVIDCVVQSLISLILWCVLEGGVVSRDGCRVGVVPERVVKECVCTCMQYTIIRHCYIFPLLVLVFN